jgi:secreted PhoX family phosphatase
VFRGGEGCWYDTDIVYFTTKFDNRVWAYDAAASEIELLYAGGGPLSGVDNVTVDPRSGDVLVAEDGGNLEIVLITPDRAVAPLLRATGPAHTGSEIAGPAMSPDGTRLYFSSQRGYGDGVTYEVRGPFRTERTRVDRGTQSPAATSEPSPSPAPSTPTPPATSSPAPTATPGAESSGDDGDARIAAAVAAGALAASGGALAWRNLRRTGRQPPSENP